ncbi:MAG: efflux RND transporter periplasmic adaptor subunit [Flavobacteriaceae bacterium]|nr:efflux RND transporter periplasmic adaptor subunit [Flavobacteriaceae bacterium]
MNKGITIFILLLLIVTVSIISFKNSESTIPSEFPKRRNISKTNFFIGKFKPNEMVKVKSEISGIIDTLYVKTGDTVSIGDKIAKLKIVPRAENLERARYTLKIAATNLKQKQSNYERNNILYKKGVIAKADLETIKLALDLAKIEFKNTQNNFNIAKYGYTNHINESPNIIKATINGEILNILVKKGMNVTEHNTFNDGSTIATIVNTSNFIFEFEVTETEFPNIKIHDTFEVSVKAINNKIIKARIKELKPLIKDDERFYYLIIAEVLNPTKQLKPGFSGLAEFILQEKNNVLSIKEKDIIYKNRKTFVETIENENKIKEIEIKVGLSDGIYTEVLSNLNITDRIKSQ